jgi:hypothetical protein
LGAILRLEETARDGGVYATQLSETALNWLTDNAVIITEERRRQHDSHGVDVTAQPDETLHLRAQRCCIDGDLTLAAAFGRQVNPSPDRDFECDGEVGPQCKRPAGGRPMAMP